MAKRKKATGFASRLKALAGNWESAQEEAKELGGGFDDFEDGFYIVALEEIKVHESQNGNLGILTSFLILDCDDDDQVGKKITKWDGLDNEERLKWVINYLVQLGVPDPDPEDLEAQLEELVEDEIGLRLELKTSEAGYQNIRIKKTGLDLSEYDMEEAYEGGEEEDDGDEEEEETQFEKGQAVQVEYDGEPWDGKILSVDEDAETCKVKFEEDGSKEDVGFDEIIVPDEEEGDEEEDEDEEYEDADDEEDEEDDEDDEEDDEGEEEDEEDDELVEPKRGDKVIVVVDGKEKEGVVTSVSKKNETVKVKVGRKKNPDEFAWDDVEIIAEPEDDE